MNKLIEVLEVQSHSRQDKFMREYLYKELASIEGVTYHDDGDNIYATKGSAPYPCVVAHMDTVHHLTSNLTAVVINGRITGMNALTMTQHGIGGDDKVGIYVALEMLREHTNIKAFFPKDEEIGCVGSAKVNVSFFDDVTIALQCDRKGNKDFVNIASGVQLSSAEFQKDVLPILGNYGYSFSNGLMTDVMELKQRGIKSSMANISCGYYNPHCENEYVDIADVHRVTMMVSHIIRELGGTFYPHEMPKRTWDRSDVEFNWWNDDRSMLSNNPLDTWCADCQMKPASGPNGMCGDCWDWYKEQNKLHEIRKAKKDKDALVAHVRAVFKQPQGEYGNSRIINTVADVKKEVRAWKRKKKRAHF